MKPTPPKWGLCSANSPTPSATCLRGCGLAAVARRCRHGPRVASSGQNPTVSPSSSGRGTTRCNCSPARSSKPSRRATASCYRQGRGAKKRRQGPNRARHRSKRDETIRLLWSAPRKTSFGSRRFIGPFPARGEPMRMLNKASVRHQLIGLLSSSGVIHITDALGNNDARSCRFGAL